MIMNFRDEDRLWGPQLHSRLLQSHTIVGFWGKKSDEVRVQPGQPSFLFVMGTGGKLLRCSGSHARLCEAWRERFGQQRGLNLFIEASWNRWRCSWAFCLLSAAPLDDDLFGAGTPDGKRVPRAAGGQNIEPAPATLHTIDQATSVAQFCEDPSDSKKDPQRAKNTVGDNGPEVPPSTEVERRPAEGQKFPRSRAIPANPATLHPSCLLDAVASSHALQSVCQDACCAELDGRSPGEHLPSRDCLFLVGDPPGFRSPKLLPCCHACSLNAPPFVGTLGFNIDRSPSADCLLGFSPCPTLAWSLPPGCAGTRMQVPSRSRSDPTVPVPVQMLS